jgi:glycosyltransferase involved in cell wall biosynthesis
MESELTVVLPVFNEQSALPAVLPGLLSYCAERGWRVILVNDGSTDETARIIADHARHPSLSVVTHKVNRGYGGALKSGIANARTEFVLTMDADGQHHLEDIDRLVRVLHDENADMVVGSRRGQRGASAYREFGKWIIRTVARMMMPVPIHDINSGFKVYRTQPAAIVTALCPDSMAFSDLMTLIFVYARMKVLEAPIGISERIGGTSTISTRSALQTLQELVNITMLFRPIRVYLPLALACFAIGIPWAAYFLLEGRGLSVAAMLVLVTGLLLTFIGLIGEQVAMLRRGPFERELRALDIAVGPPEAP